MAGLPRSSVPPPPPPSQPPVSEAPPQVQETVVVPTEGENPFVPKSVTVPAEGLPQTSAAPPPVSRKGSIFGRILLILVLLLLIGGAIFGVKYALSFIATQKEATITYWGLWENDTTIQPIIADFEANHPKIKVEYIRQSPSQYRERLQAAINRGEGPDIFRFHNTWVAMLRNELLPVPSTVMTQAEFASTFYPVASANLVAGQTIYGIPMMIDGLGLYYNEDLFVAAGVTVPTTWGEVVTLTPRLTVRSENTILSSAIALGTTGNVEHASDIIATMMMQNGANLLSPTGKVAEDTLVFYHEFADPVNPVYTWNETFDNSVYAFATGKVAMILAPSWRVFDIKQINPSLRFKIAPIPQLPGNTVNWASYWVEGVSVKSKYREQAWEFVKYLTGKEAVTKLYTEEAKTRLFGEPYARVDLGSTLTDDPYIGAYIKEAPTSKSFPLASRTFDNGINDKLIKYLEDAVNGLGQGLAPTAVLQTAASGFRQVLGSYGLTSAAAATQ